MKKKTITKKAKSKNIGFKMPEFGDMKSAIDEFRNSIKPMPMPDMIEINGVHYVHQRHYENAKREIRELEGKIECLK